MPNSMFHDPNDEKRLCQVLKSYVEEFGPKSVVVNFPKNWYDSCNHYNIGVEIKFLTENTVEIFGGNDYKFSMELARHELS